MSILCFKPLLNLLTGLYRAVWDLPGPWHRVTHQPVFAYSGSSWAMVSPRCSGTITYCSGSTDQGSWPCDLCRPTGLCPKKRLCLKLSIYILKGVSHFIWYGAAVMCNLSFWGSLVIYKKLNPSQGANKVTESQMWIYLPHIMLIKIQPGFEFGLVIGHEVLILQVTSEVIPESSASGRGLQGSLQWKNLNWGGREENYLSHSNLSWRNPTSNPGPSFLT